MCTVSKSHKLFVHLCLFINLLILIMDLSTTFASIRKQVAGLSLVALVTGIFATGVATAATGNIFSDVPADAWFAPYVNGLSEQGVIDSTSDMYRPGDLVNRAEMAKFAFMVSGLPMETAAEAPYKDVAMGQWYTDYVYTLTKNGIVSGDKLDGVPTGYFRPGDNLNRAEASKMLVNSAQMAEDISGAPHFPDVTTSYWYYNYVETLFNNGVIAGYPDGYFRPANNINRAEVAKMVYLSMNPVAAGFSLESAAAASKTSVELIFSMNVDTTLAADEANYMIEDSTGNKLAVSAAVVTAGDTVMLTTATQTEGKVYYASVKNLESDAGDMLANLDSVSFLGYGADVSGGPLSVALSTQTPVAGSVPSGATGVVFTCWDFAAGSDAATIKSLHVHRVGPGNSTAFTNLYLYRGDMRLTTGRTINSETQKAEFNNINQTVAAGENMKVCLVGDLAANSNGGVHAFELLAADDVMSNSSDMTGSFPLRGADQLITNATVGQTTISVNGALDELTVGQVDGRIAQFELEADGAEDQYLNRIALYIRGSVTVSDIKNLKLFALGDTTALATTAEVGAKELATFKLAKPFKIGRGQKKIFYVTADLSPGRNGDNIKTYLDESTDLFVEGATFGYGTRVVKAAYDGSAPANFSNVIIKGSDFNVAFTGPSAQDVAIGQNGVRCLDLTITNGSGSDVEIKNWEAILDIQNPATTVNGGLWNEALSAGNYTLIKLARVNDDGSLAGTLLGPTEVVAGVLPSALDDMQTVVLGGTSTIAANESVKAAIVFNTANNVAMAGDKIRCSLKDLTGVSDSVRDQNGDALTSSSITPAAQIDGNTMTVVQSALKVAVAATPSSKTVVKGATNVEVLGLSLVSGSSLDNTVKTLTIQGWIDGKPDGTVAFATPSQDGVLLKDVINNLALYDGATQVGSFGNISSITGKVTFNNLTVKVPKNTTKNLILKGNVSNSTVNGVRIKFGVIVAGDVVSIDQNGQTVSGIDIASADNGLTADSGVRVTINSSGTVNVSESGSDAGALLGGTTTGVNLAKLKFTVTNADAILDDMSLGVTGEASTLSKVYIYDSSCSSQLGSLAGYDVVSGSVFISGANLTLPVGNVTLCFKGDMAAIKDSGTDQPSSGSRTGLYLRDITKLSSGGSEISNTGAVSINSNAIAGGVTLGAAALNTDTTLSFLSVLPNAFAAGDLLFIGKELVLATAPCVPTTPAVLCTVRRGIAGTTAVGYAAGSEVRLSNMGVAALAAPATVKKDDVIVVYNADIDTVTGGAQPGTVVYLSLQDNPTLPAHVVLISNSLGIPGANVLPYAPADLMSRFTLHGNSSVVRKAYPTFANISTAEGIVGGNVIASGSTESQRSLMAFSITAAGAGSVELKKNIATPANSAQIRYNITGGAFDTVTSPYCALYDTVGNKLAGLGTTATGANFAGVIDGTTTIAVVDTLAAGANTFVMGYDAAPADPGFAGGAVYTSGLVVNAGSTGKVTVKCNIDASAVGGQSIQASLVNVFYSDGTALGAWVSDLSLYVQKFVNLIGPNQGEII